MFMPAQPNLTTKDGHRPDPNEKLIKVFDSEQESEAMVVKGLLDSANIESDLAAKPDDDDSTQELRAIE
jgi:hypothetical protein